MVGQTRISSAVEASLNIGSGFILSLVIWIVWIVPAWDLDVSMFDNFTITCIFTVASIIRSYVWRRIFNHYHVRRWEWLVTAKERKNV